MSAVTPSQLASAQPVLSAEVVDPASLSTEARAQLCDELYQAQRLIFAEVSRSEFCAYVVESPAVRSRIQVFRAEGRVVGYAAMHFFVQQLDGRDVGVIRAEVGMLRAWRGRCAFGYFMCREAMSWRLRHPRMPLYGMACPIHPASYRALARYSARAWPRPEQATPADIEALMMRLGDTFHLSAPGADRGVRSVGWVTRETESEAAWWGRHSDPRVQYYLSRNPSYQVGHGLLTLVPVDLPTVLAAVGRIAWRQLTRAFRCCQGPTIR